MGLLVILPLGTVAGWAIARIFLWIRRGKFDRQWLKAFAILAAAGAMLGIWLAFLPQYTVSGTKHIRGFPIPIEIMSREKPDAPWGPPDMPVVIRAAAVVSDFLFGIAVCLVPLAVGAFFKENRGKGEFAAVRPPDNGNRA